MLLRYKTDATGNIIKRACVYSAEEHGIYRKYIDNYALLVIRRLQAHGYSAYLVGGAIRDLLLGIQPKDFDVVTDAKPNNVRKLFWNSRVIGKRFKLVHIQFKRDVIEVSTFRADSKDNNRFGTMEEDVQRRDFSINGLYYCPEREQIIDYVNGYRDIQKKRIRALIPLNRIFKEDPVRMVRAIKYSGVTEFSLSRGLKRSIKKHVHLLSGCSSSRMTEEVFKILQSGRSKQIIITLHTYGLLHAMLPRIAELLDSRETTKSGESVKDRLLADLTHLDKRVAKKKSIKRGEMLQYLLQEILIKEIESHPEEQINYQELFRICKIILKPITPPNLEVEWAVKRITRRYIP